MSSRRVHENRNKENKNAPNLVSANPMKQHIKGLVPSQPDIWRTAGLTAGEISKKTIKEVRQSQPYLAFAGEESLQNLRHPFLSMFNSKSKAFIQAEKLQKPNFHLAIEETFIEVLLYTKHRGLESKLQRTWYLTKDFIHIYIYNIYIHLHILIYNMYMYNVWNQSMILKVYSEYSKKRCSAFRMI